MILNSEINSLWVSSGILRWLLCVVLLLDFGTVSLPVPLQDSSSLSEFDILDCPLYATRLGDHRNSPRFHSQVLHVFWILLLKMAIVKVVESWDGEWAGTEVVLHPQTAGTLTLLYLCIWKACRLTANLRKYWFPTHALSQNTSKPSPLAPQNLL